MNVVLAVDRPTRCSIVSTPESGRFRSSPRTSSWIESKRALGSVRVFLRRLEKLGGMRRLFLGALDAHLGLPRSFLGGPGPPVGLPSLFLGALR